MPNLELINETDVTVRVVLVGPEEKNLDVPAEGRLKILLETGEYHCRVTSAKTMAVNEAEVFHGPIDYTWNFSIQPRG